MLPSFSPRLRRASESWTSFKCNKQKTKQKEMMMMMNQ